MRVVPLRQLVPVLPLGAAVARLWVALLRVVWQVGPVEVVHSLVVRVQLLGPLRGLLWQLAPP